MDCKTNQKLLLGIDVGSTTVKTVIMDENNNIVSSSYVRHFSLIKDTLIKQLEIILQTHGDCDVQLAIAGSAGMGMAQSASLPFVQEVHAAFIGLKTFFPEADAAVELGGEDAKIIFITNGAEQRMNGSCAGGTGAFIDQMATLLGISVSELDELAQKAVRKYPIAARCGVFAKSDIQPLLNQGAAREDIAASIFQAVVDQTVSGLAQGRVIDKNVVFLGGPIFFLKNLRTAFLTTLRLNPSDGSEAPFSGKAHGTAFFPEQSPVFVACGCCLYAKKLNENFLLSEVISRIKSAKSSENILTARPLFKTREEYTGFVKRHAKSDLGYLDIRSYSGDAFLGIDAGSTTTKLVLISPKGQILYTHYSPNLGQPLENLIPVLKEMYSLMTPDMRIAASAVTGYGEELIKTALQADFGIVETVAHFRAAQFFCPDVDFIIDIGGQDIKCFKIKENAIDSIMLNEACSSGCGSFLQTFAQALGYTIEDFSQLGLFSKKPVDLGSRCTVFMNSNVKQAQKDGASVEDISAGLSISVIKNAIYKVIRAPSTKSLGEHIVVQGGTFLNDAVLRAFEQELQKEVVRPAIAGLMGAFGAALYAIKNVQPQSGQETHLITPEALAELTYTSKNVTCKGCGSNCNLTRVSFSDGRRFTAGNRCEKGAGLPIPKDRIPCLYESKYTKLRNLRTVSTKTPRAVRVGLPMVLGFYEQLPFWKGLFETLGFEVVLSSESSRELYFKGQHTIPSDTVCYPAKLAHGHILSLLEKNVDFIFYPCQSYNLNEGHSDNHYNCPVVAYYPELLKANIHQLSAENFLYPYIDINLKRHTIDVMWKALRAYKITKRHISSAYEVGFSELEAYQQFTVSTSEEIISRARENNQKILVLAGRPYHLDSEINHGINKLIASLNMALITEDSVYHLSNPPRLAVLNQWTYHARLYRAAQYVTTQPDMQLVQLVSFGCGIDSITTDEVRDILESKGKLYTQLKIDEVSNLGAAKIRLRSLAAAMESPVPAPASGTVTVEKSEKELLLLGGR